VIVYYSAWLSSLASNPGHVVVAHLFDILEEGSHVLKKHLKWSIEFVEGIDIMLA